MSVQVSYKKQFSFGILLLVVILLVIEGFANIWWYEIKACAFENNELFENMDDKTKKLLCLENFELKYTELSLDPNQKRETFYINNEGFRGTDITKHKPENTFRIFVIGGSTTFGSGVYNNQTAPFYLQKFFDKTELDFKVEVINAGIPGGWSEQEKKLVKERLLDYLPDLLIIYDGINELGAHFEGKNSPTLFKENWIEICDLGKEYGFETIISLQPFFGTGNRIQHEDESHITTDERWLTIYPLYIKQLDELDAHCTKTTDLRQIFDSTPQPIYWDSMHVVAKGNKVVAENFYKLSLPIVLDKGFQKDSIEKSEDMSIEQKDSKISNENYDGFVEETYQNFRNILFYYKTPRVLEYLSNSFDNHATFQTKLNQDNKNNLENLYVRANLAGWDFSGKNLENTIFTGSKLSNANFENANLKGADFRFANLNGANFYQANLVGVNFANADLSVANLQGANLEGSILNNADLSVANLLGANLEGSSLNHADLSVANLQGTNLKYTQIVESTLHVTNLVNADLTGSQLDGSDLFGANLDGAIVNGTSLKETKLACYNHHICN